jgi:tRNA(fMet)-specific endonuclease VapC
MEPITLLDTDILSNLHRSHPRVMQRASRYLAEHATLGFSLMTRFEIMRGLKANRSLTQLAAFEAFCQSHEILPLDERVIVRAADIYADLKSRGQLIPDADMLIAATALEHGMVLATNNLADFRRINSLQIDNWLI